MSGLKDDNPGLVTSAASILSVFGASSSNTFHGIDVQCIDKRSQTFTLMARVLNSEYCQMSGLKSILHSVWNRMQHSSIYSQEL